MMNRVDEIRAMLLEGNEIIIANRAGSSLGDLLEEVDALRARCAAAEGDLLMVCTMVGPCAACRHCCDRGPDFPCAISDAWCSGEKWQWRGPIAVGDAQSAPGGAL